MTLLLFLYFPATNSKAASNVTYAFLKSSVLYSTSPLTNINNGFSLIAKLLEIA